MQRIAHRREVESVSGSTAACPWPKLNQCRGPRWGSFSDALSAHYFDWPINPMDSDKRNAAGLLGPDKQRRAPKSLLDRYSAEPLPWAVSAAGDELPRFGCTLRRPGIAERCETPWSCMSSGAI